MVERTKLFERAISAKRESRALDFKREFDPSSSADWCEIIKDIVAFANSGGGAIVFGVDDDGVDAEIDLSAVRNLDIADLANRVQKYTGIMIPELEIVDLERNGKSKVAFIIGGSDVPVVFTSPGTYDIGNGKQKSAFAKGTIYFRHGGKSEPGNHIDLLKWRDREIERIRKGWLGGIRKVVEAPSNHAITVISSPTPAMSGGRPVTVAARISDDPMAIKLAPQNTEEIWPYRQKELIRQIVKRYGSSISINGHDIYCLNRNLDVLNKHKEFAFKPHTLASPQYSDAYVDWIVGQLRKDKSFFRQVRQKFKDSTITPSK